VGDPIEVSAKEVIAAGLDLLDKRDGCLFMPQMWTCCGQSFKIKKVVNCFFDEFRYKMYQPKAPTYLLENVMCHGDAGPSEQRCDRSCYLLWHEDWLDSV
jgi:hypothetical protein